MTTLYITIELKRADATEAGRIDASVVYVSKSIEDFVRTHVLAMQALAREIESGDCDQGDCLTDQLRFLRLAHPNFTSVAVTDANAVVWAVSAMTESKPGHGTWLDLPVPEPAYFQDLKQGGATEAYVSGAINAPAGKAPSSVVVAVPRYDAQGRFNGLLQATLNLRGLANLGHAALAGIDYNGEILLLDSQFNLITATSQKTPGLEPLIERLRAGRATGDYYQAQGLHQRYVSMQMGNPPWTLVVQTPYRQTRGFHIPLFALIGWLALLLMALAWILSKYLVQWIAHPAPPDAPRTLPPHPETGLTGNESSHALEVKRIQAAFVGLVERLRATQQAQRELLVARAEANKALAATIADRDREIAEQTAQLRQALADAGDAAETKDRLLANTSHEMRTPLNGIIGRAELLLLQDLTEAQRADVRTIMQCADGLLQLINDLLDLTRLRGHMMHIANERFDLRDVVATVSAVMRPLAEQRGLRLVQHMAENVHAYWMGDALRLRQVLLNLVGNAIKFTEFGEVRIQVSETSGGRLRIAVEDTGIGIAPADLERIFDPFIQVDSGSARASQGSGLGLAISRQLVELMGGTLSVDSQPGRGSVFVVNLWLTPTHEPSQATPLPEASKPAHSHQVLVVDDVDINRDVLVSQLATLGIQADSARDGFEALEKIAAQRYDLVLLDCQMPGMDGYEVAARISKEWPAQVGRIVAVTAHAMPTERQRCLDAGMNDYIAKPVRLAQLRNLLAPQPGSIGPASP